MAETKSKLSLTTLALGMREAEAVIPLWLEHQDWEVVSQMVTEENLFQKAAETSTHRIMRVLRPRLEVLDIETLEDFVDSDTEDRKAILLIAACKSSPLLLRFIIEVLAEKIIVYDYSLANSDFDTFWNRLVEEDTSIEPLSDTTLKKTRQVLLRTLHEAGLLSSSLDARITPIHFSAKISGVIAREGSYLREIFLSA